MGRGWYMRKILLLPIFAVLITVLSLLPQDAHAATSIDLKDQASCEAAPLSGTWITGNSTCRIGSLTLNSGDSLLVDYFDFPVKLTTTSTLFNNGTIRTNCDNCNYGTIINEGTI